MSSYLFGYPVEKTFGSEILIAYIKSDMKSICNLQSIDFCELASYVYSESPVHLSMNVFLFLQ